jgi:hypothetical protein
MASAAQWRFTAALAASCLLHAWLMHGAAGVRVLRVEPAHAPLSVALHLPDVDWLLAADGPAPPAVKPVDAYTPPTPRHSEAQPQPVAAAPLPSPTAEREFTGPSDLHYYPAASLDVFPSAMAALDLNVRLKDAAGAGEVRATVLIDEAGVVNDIRDMRLLRGESEQAQFAARELLLAARFTPARKDGRIVRAQVVLSLRYGSAP